VVDEVGHFPAYLPAEVLADAGAEVVVSTGKLSHGSGLDSATLMTMHTRLARKGVEFLVHAAATGIVDGAVHFRDTLSGAEFERQADAVVLAFGNTATDGLAAQLNGRIFTVGDAAAPRTVTEAVREGHLVGREL
jgi:pyruvate/2-oxoglutarate dehydrogenase complex dihydrolipoamide dehydrogenase (E3) component